MRVLVKDRWATWLPYLVFIAAFGYMYLPYFLFCPLPDILPDSYGYFYVAKQIHEGYIPLPPQPIDTPVGFSLFILAVKGLFGTTGAIVVAQVLLFFGGSLFFIWQFSRLSARLAWPAALAMLVYALNPYTIRLNTCLYTESIYTTSLLILVGLVARAWRKKTLGAEAAVVMFVLVPCLIRPNAVYLFMLPILFMFRAVVVYSNWRHVKNIGLAMGAMLLVWSGINYVTKGFFAPGDLLRVLLVVKSNKYTQEHPEGYYKTQDGFKKTTAETYTSLKYHILKDAVNNFAETKPSFYHSFLLTRYGYMYARDMYNDPTQKIYNRVKADSVDAGLKDYMMAEYVGAGGQFTSVPVLFNLQNPESRLNKWVYSTHFIYKLYNLLVWRKVWVGLYYMLMALVLIQLLASKFKSASAYFLGILFLLHVVSLLTVVVGHNGLQVRYAHVTEFLIPLTILLVIFNLFKPSTIYSGAE